MEQMRAEIKDHISFTYGPSAWKEVLRIEADMRRKRKQELYRKQEQIDAIINFAIGFIVFAISGGVLFCLSISSVNGKVDGNVGTSLVAVNKWNI